MLFYILLYLKRRNPRRTILVFFFILPPILERQCSNFLASDSGQRETELEAIIFVRIGSLFLQTEPKRFRSFLCDVLESITLITSVYAPRRVLPASSCCSVWHWAIPFPHMFHVPSDARFIDSTDMCSHIFKPCCLSEFSITGCRVYKVCTQSVV